MFYDELRLRLKPCDLTQIAQEMKVNETVLRKKIEKETLTMDELFHLIRCMRSLSMIAYMMGEMNTAWKEKYRSTLN
jgi:hypothetical protein